jgi:hydroxymethylglutaryl-CoA reductase
MFVILTATGASATSSSGCSSSDVSVTDNAASLRSVVAHLTLAGERRLTPRQCEARLVANRIAWPRGRGRSS